VAEEFDGHHERCAGDEPGAGAVYDGAEVFVNGQRCGYHESGFTAFDIDVTKALKPGQRNLMAIRVYKKTSSGALDHGDFWCLGGMIGNLLFFCDCSRRWARRRRRRGDWTLGRLRQGECRGDDDPILG
jgi:hypothetical protein